MNKAILVMILCLGGIPATAALADVGSIVQTMEGVESDVKGSITDVNKRIENAFKQLGIQSTGSHVESSGNKQTITGKSGNTDVNIQLTPTGANQTHVIVTAKQGAVSWNKDLAQQILSKIIQST